MPTRKQLVIRDVPFWYGRGGSGYGAWTYPFKAYPQERPELHAAIDGSLQRLELAGFPVTNVDTAGTYVRKNIGTTNVVSPHAFGIGIDGDAFGFAEHGTLVIGEDCCDANKRPLPVDEVPLMYFVVGAALRYEFSTVLGIWYNAAHWDHYHCDTQASRKPFGGQQSTTAFVQSSLHKLGFDAGAIDRETGPTTKRAFDAWYASVGQSRQIGMHDHARMGRELADYWLSSDVIAQPPVVEPDEPAEPTPWELELAESTRRLQEAGISDGERPDELISRGEDGVRTTRTIDHILRTAGR